MTGHQLTHSQKTRRLVIAASLLLVTLLCIVGGVLWTDARNATSTLQAQPDVQRIRIQRPDFPDMVLQADTDGQWSMSKPCLLPINSQRLQPLLDALMTPAVHGYAAVDVDLEAAGLLHPEALIIMNDEVLALGITDLSGERRYLQRGERVEFVPEWILSLVNGGLSALASLAVFPQTLDELVVQTDQSANPASLTVEADALPQWQALQAQQIVTWPLQDSEPATGSRTLIARTGDQELKLTLQLYTRYAALRHENADCAYLLPTSSLPDITLP